MARRSAPDTSFDPSSPDFPSARPARVRTGTRESRMAEWFAKKGKKRRSGGGSRGGGKGGASVYGFG